MIEIQPEHRAQTLNMVRTQGTKVLAFDRQWTFYAVDGYAWMTTSTGLAYRCDSSIESAVILRLAAEVDRLNQRVRELEPPPEETSAQKHYRNATVTLG